MATKKSKIHVCIDRVLPMACQVRGAEVAGREKAANLPKMPKAMPMSHEGALGMALVRKKLWQPGRVLNVKFLDGDTTQRKKVEDRAHRWEQFANIKFKFGSAANPEIRISFTQEGSWSAVGTDCLVQEYFKPDEPTMNYGWLTADTEDDEYDRVVLHEFGHALGAIHEHQSPAGGINWNKPAVYRYFGGPPNNWSKEEVDHNLLERYSKTQTNFTKFDPDSIMLYAFPAELTLDGKGTHSNTTMSSMDKKFMAANYPQQAKSAGA